MSEVKSLKGLEPIIFSVSEDKAKMRLDLFLKEVLPNFSRNYLQKLLREGLITVDGKKAKPSLKLKEGQKIEITLPEESPLEIEPQDVPFEILYEDKDLAVIYKPPGVVVHPAPGHSDKTLVHGLLLKLKNLSGIGGKLRPGIVHRLDKDTSGIMLIAKNDYMHRALTQAFKNRNIQKIYLAILYEKIEPPKGRIEKPIGRHPVNRKKMAVIKEGKTAITEYEVIKYFKKASFVYAKPVTGRTHQLRVHFSYLGHPILGDPIYGGLKPNIHRPERLMLHAWKITFLHPLNQKEMTFEKDPPEDFQNYLNYLESVEGIS